MGTKVLQMDTKLVSLSLQFTNGTTPGRVSTAARRPDFLGLAPPFQILCPIRPPISNILSGHVSGYES